MSDVVKRDLYGLIDKELEAANQKFPLFNSTHEAFAVILEEAEEAKEEAGNLDILMNNFWIGVKENHDPEALHEELQAFIKRPLIWPWKRYKPQPWPGKALLAVWTFGPWINAYQRQKGGVNYEPEKSDRSSTGRNGDHE